MPCKPSLARSTPAVAFAHGRQNGREWRLPFTPFDMCPSIHSLPPFAFLCHCGLGWKRDGHCCTLSPHSSHFCSAPKLTCRRRRSPFSLLWTVVCHVGNCRFQRHSSARWKYLGTYRWRATAFHDICCPAAGTALSIAKGQMGEKPCSGSPSLFLPSRLLRPPTPPHRRGGCEKEAIHALYHSSRAKAAWQAALSSVMASNGIGIHTPSRSLGLPTPASNGWIGVSSSVSQRPTE